MLSAMQNLALSYLWKEIEGSKLPPDDLRKWFIDEKKIDPGKFFPFLVETSGKIEKYYTLSADPNNKEMAILESSDIGSLSGNIASFLPYIDTPPNGAKYPVLKRTLDKNKIPTPKKSIIETSFKQYQTFIKEFPNVSNFFTEVLDAWKRKKVLWAGTVYNTKSNALELSISLINESNSVFLTYKDNNNLLPGQRKDYSSFFSSILGESKYTLKKAIPALRTCYLCNSPKKKCYPGGLPISGINFFNFDRIGSFPGINEKNAHLSYAICENCADLLYIFKFHVIDKYITYIAGQETLILPELYLNPKLLNNFLSNFYVYVEQLNKTPAKALILEKKRLVKLLSNEKAICTLDIIWSKDSLKGQSIGNLSGQISDILPSRLRKIDNSNKKFREIQTALFPQHPVEGFDFDLTLSFFNELLYRPGGKKAKNINTSRKLVELKRLTAEAVYKQKPLPESRFWEEIMVTADWYMRNLFGKDNPEIDCLYEGFSEKKNTSWMSLAGWIKHLSMAIYYFTFMEVMNQMENKRTYYPEMESLKEYFSDGCGINTDEKAYAFILGILYGRVMQIQGAKGVNVGSNALTWLKRLNLNGKDLPELYIRIREKLLAYEAEVNENVRAIIKEIGLLGNKLGDEIDLDQVPCCYFLLLGQSIAVDLFPKKSINK